MVMVMMMMMMTVTLGMWFYEKWMERGQECWDEERYITRFIIWSICSLYGDPFTLLG